MLKEKNQTSKLFRIPCTISRGGFTEERVFELNLEGLRVKGAAPLDYFTDNRKKPLSPDVPPIGQTIQGFIAAKLVDADDDNGTMILSLPSGDVIEIRSDNVATD
jgi:hypothetical protein